MAEINPTAVNWTNLDSPVSPAVSAAASNVAASFWGEDGFSFGDILDLINPLQHLPIIGTLYRAATDDEISTGSNILGGALFGGVIGAGVAVVNSIIEETTGGEIDDHITAMFGAGEPSTADDAPATAVLASAESHDGYGAAFGRRAQEATWSDSTSHGSTTTTAPAAPVSAERRYASNPAYGRRAQEATMTSMASINGYPAALALGATTPDGAAPALAARPVIEPVIHALATPTAQGAPVAENPAWLAATPRAESDFTTAAMRYMTPETGLQLARVIAGNPEYKPTPGRPSEIPHDAIDRYNQWAMAAKVMTIEPGIIDNLY